MDKDLRDLLRLLRDNPQALTAEEHIELGQIMCEKFGSVENVRREIEAVTGEKHVI